MMTLEKMTNQRPKRKTLTFPLFFNRKQLLYKDKPIDRVSSKLIRRIEMSLYRSSPSSQAYADLSTLKQRIKSNVLKNEKTNNGNRTHAPLLEY